MKNYKLVIFDWDGTIINSIGLIVHSIKKTAEEFKVPAPTDEQIRKFISFNSTTHLLELFPALDERKTVAAFRQHYVNSLDKEQPFPGAEKTLQALTKRGLHLAIATNKVRSALDSSMHHHKLTSYFSTIRTADGAYAKPHPGVIYTILAEMQLRPDHALMIGDSPCDMLVAKNSGIDAVAVSYGISSKDHLLSHEPVACIDHIEKLLDLFD